MTLHTAPATNAATAAQAQTAAAREYVAHKGVPFKEPPSANKGCPLPIPNQCSLVAISVLALTCWAASMSGKRNLR